MDGKPSILFVGNFLSGPALDRYPSGDLALHLERVGWSVALTSRRINKVLRLCDMLSTVWRKRRCYEVALVDVFHGQAFLWAEWSARLLRRIGKPFLLTLHGGKLPEFAQRHPARVRRLLESAYAVTTPSRYFQEAMRPYRTDLVVLPNAVDLSRYEFRLRDRPTPSLVWLRAFRRIYNPALAVLVLADVLKEYPSASLTMVGPDKGDGTLRELKAEIGRLRLREQVRLLGAVDKSKVPAVLNQGDIFLNTTNGDNTPVSVIEAMACGLCVVSTRVGGMPFLVDQGQDGLLVPPGDVGALTRAVGSMLSDCALATRVSRNARTKAAGFDWAAVLPRWERLLKNAARRAGATAPGR